MLKKKHKMTKINKDRINKDRINKDRINKDRINKDEEIGFDIVFEDKKIGTQIIIEPTSKSSINGRIILWISGSDVEDVRLENIINLYEMDELLLKIASDYCYETYIDGANIHIHNDVYEFRECRGVHLFYNRGDLKSMAISFNTRLGG